MHARIICIGNSLFAPDAAGPMVHDLLADGTLPASVGLIDGGLGGLNLLPFLEDCDLALFVDAVAGFRETPGIVILNPLSLPDESISYGHDAGLGYLLKAASHVLAGLPEMLLIGIEGDPTPTSCRQAADACLALIAGREGTSLSPIDPA
jgi:hydrogenase maturation protease